MLWALLVDPLPADAADDLPKLCHQIELNAFVAEFLYLRQLLPWTFLAGPSAPLAVVSGLF